PNLLLASFLKELDFRDPTLLIPPGIGEDTAAVSVEREEVLVLKSDPITFVTDSIGYYSVVINANDIATSGADPRWFLSTMLFPPGTVPSTILKVMHDLKDCCLQVGVTLCGGHTEITDAVNRPVITGTMIGTVSKSDLIDKRAMKPGDAILLTKGVAVEGTAIIASEFADRLKELGMSDDEIMMAKEFIDGLSIMEEAQIAGKYTEVSGMHDVTEGGLATALKELGIAGGYGISVDIDQITVYRPTAKICGLLDINPLGLIGSGSLLICCRECVCETLMMEIENAGIEVARIGQVTAEYSGIEAFRQGRPVKWPDFETDEITRLYSN
ncbi:MAG: hydrogenase expression protein, partial [Proteobacteria bacterium]|nr:hydrogenase expression protein [Pseudomonadota bacterium]